MGKENVSNKGLDFNSGLSPLYPFKYHIVCTKYNQQIMAISSHTHSQVFA